MGIEVRLAVAGAIALSLAGCNKADDKAADKAPITPITAPAGTSWIETVSETPEGGFRMGNPAAPVKLVEYASLTCPHCREFEEAGASKLRDNYVATGKVSWEFRSFALNQIDVSATLLAVCQGAGPFFKLIEQSYLEQEKWIVPFQKMTEDQQRQLAAMPQMRQFLGLAQAGGLDTFYRVRGLPSAKAEACLTSQAGVDKIVALRDRGMKQDGVEGTPTFLINGAKVDGPPTWENLEPALQKAVG